MKPRICSTPAADVLDHRRRGEERRARLLYVEVVLEGLGPAVDHAERVVQVVRDGAGEETSDSRWLLAVVVSRMRIMARGGRLGVGHREGGDLQAAGDAVLVDVVELLGLDLLARQRPE